jgi:hypothetical protein
MSETPEKCPTVREVIQYHSCLSHDSDHKATLTVLLADLDHRGMASLHCGRVAELERDLAAAVEERDRLRKIDEFQLQYEPELGDIDESKCRPGWIETLTRWYKAEEDKILNHWTVGAILHMLMADKKRVERLLAERDRLQKELAGLKSLLAENDWPTETKADIERLRRENEVLRGLLNRSLMDGFGYTRFWTDADIDAALKQEN